MASHIVPEGSFFDAAEAAGPGYLNFRLSPRWYEAVLEAAMLTDEVHSDPLSEEEAIRLLLDAAPGASMDPYLPLRRDRGNPLYRLRYALQRLSRLPEPENAVKLSAFSPAEQALIKSIAASRSVEAEEFPRSAAHCLLSLADTLQSCHAASRLAGTSPDLRILTAARKTLENGMNALGML